MQEHKHHAKSSIKFLDSDEILSQLDLKGNEVFMDAGCGDGHIAIKAIEDYLPDGLAYAVDNYEPSIEELEEYKAENNLENLININADITSDMAQIEDNSIDMIFMLNVVHGFKASGNMDDVVENLLRILKTNGKFAIVEFRPIEWSFGPPVEIKYAPEELESIFIKFGFKKVYLNEDLGLEGPDGKSHYLIIFEKESAK
ncbi:class I SAM-dependent methyltransferase [Methanobrevibacter sp.]|uniref:class I SAM-dependent methyltransferase n=1 Tax=Methanobrevibacter sp. TaxID=66852 RepID=UPI0038649F8B